MNIEKLFKPGNYLTDGGLETTLLFIEKIELNEFAAFELLLTEKGRGILKNYYEQYIKIAGKYKLNFLLESPTYRASADWGEKIGYNIDQLNKINKDSIEFLRSIASKNNLREDVTIVSGCVGPRGDGYSGENKMSVEEATRFHSDQITAFSLADADIVSAFTMTNAEEATGIALAAKAVNIPAVISFTVETDGKLPDGELLKDAIEHVEKETGNYPLYYMINCAHPEHFKNVFNNDEDWKHRIKGVRANASCKSHVELDNSETLDFGDMDILAQNYKELNALLPSLKVYGGCCGTDHRHMGKICDLIFKKNKKK